MTSKQFALLLFLGLRRSDGTDGAVAREEVVRRVPWWQGESAENAGKDIARYLASYAWFKRRVEYVEKARGPWRLRTKDVKFEPDRDAANEFISSPRMATKLRRPPRIRRQRLTDTELQAYDLLVQSGVYLPAVVDLIVQRIGDPGRLREPGERLTAYRILATLAKNRGRPEQVRAVAVKAIKLARRLGRNDDVAYLLDQLGCAYHIEGRYAEARRYFQEEIQFLTNWNGQRASFHLVSAYRALAMTLRALGDTDHARAAIGHSARYAKLSHHDEGLRLGRLVEAQLDGKVASLELGEVLQQLPLGDRVGQLMFLNTMAERLLEQGDRSGGEELLRHTYEDARRLEIPHVAARSRAVAERFGMTHK